MTEEKRVPGMEQSDSQGTEREMQLELTETETEEVEDKESLLNSSQVEAREEVKNSEENSSQVNDGEEVECGEATSDKPIKHKILKRFFGFLLYAAIIVMCLFLVPKYVMQRTSVDGSSMRNTLHNGDQLLVEKISYHFEKPKRYDIIVFYPHGKSENDSNPFQKSTSDYYVKRVIGLPGETVQIKEGHVYINGKKLKKDYGNTLISEPGEAANPLKVTKNHYFVMGDNRLPLASNDSRGEDVGLVDCKNIDGKVCFRLYPFSKFGVISPKPTVTK